MSQAGITLLIIAGLCVLYIIDKLPVALVTTIGMLALAVTFHGIFNILVSQTGIAARVGFLIPVLTAVFLQVLFRRKK